MPERRTRADRILDAAGELLLRLGHRKVTIEDIAKRADVGKGTVYLHWRTKDVLFRALFLRESIDLVEDLVHAVRDDPNVIRPHRFVERSFLLGDGRPLLRALFTGDLDLIGVVKRQESQLKSQDMLATDEFFEVMFRHGLLRDDVPNIGYALQATGTGFQLYDTVRAEDEEQPDTQAKATALAHTIRHAFEPAAVPSPEDVTRAATELCAVFENLISTYRKWIYEHDPEIPGR